jgi:hypothetical protein
VLKGTVEGADLSASAAWSTVPAAIRWDENGSMVRAKPMRKRYQEELTGPLVLSTTTSVLVHC